MNQRGILIVVSGFSGAGKGTLMKELMKRYEETYALSVSATTRNPREGEVDGREYFFKTTEEFEKMIAKEELIEYARYVENYYGTPRTYVEQQLEAGKDVILEIEIQGSAQGKGTLSGHIAFVCDAAVCQRAAQTSGRKRDRDHGGDRVQTGKGSGGVRVHGSV